MSRADTTYRVVLAVPTPAGRLRIPSSALTRGQADRLWAAQVAAGGAEAFGPDGPCRSVIVTDAEYARTGGAR